jgi:hypothetical protein
MKPRTEIVSERLIGNGGGDVNVTPEPYPRIELLDEAGYYAQLENDGKVIKFYSREGLHLFGLNPELIAFEQKLLTIAVQLYLMAFNQGHKTGYEACKTKLSEVIKLCV